MKNVFTSICISLTTLVLLSFVALAQPYSVSGKVTDFVSTHGLQGVIVSANGQTCVTDAEGNYTIPNLPQSQQVITATLQNYVIDPVTIAVSTDMNNQNLIGKGESKVLNVVPLKARKDTAMLCLDGCRRAYTVGGPGGTAYFESLWNEPRETAQYVSAHDANYCSYTSAVMLNRYYGGTVSRDETVLHVHRKSAPEGETGHGQSGLAYQNDWEKMVRWVLGDPAETEVSISKLNEEISDEDYKRYINEGRPMYWSGLYNGFGHAMVVAGYRYVDSKLELYLLNVDNEGNTSWVEKGSASYTFYQVIVPSVTSVGIKQDPLLSKDSDGDGVTDFDEKYRWIGNFNLDETKADTDGDGLPDGKDIEGWLFRGQDTPVGKGLFDEDNDGLRGEVDPDSDNGGVRDGDEDFNFNASKDKNETDPYEPLQPNADDIPKVKITLEPSTKAAGKTKVTGKATATFLFLRKDGSTDLRVFDEKAGPLTVQFTPEGGQAITVKLTPTGELPTATWTGELEITSKTPVGKAEFQVKNGSSDVEIIEGKEFYISLDGAKSLIKE